MKWLGLFLVVFLASALLAQPTTKPAASRPVTVAYGAIEVAKDAPRPVHEHFRQVAVEIWEIEKNLKSKPNRDRKKRLMQRLKLIKSPEFRPEFDTAYSRFLVKQVVDERTLLIEHLGDDAALTLSSTDKYIDDTVRKMDAGVLVHSGTFKYSTVLGAARTVRMYEVVNPETFVVTP
jgi:hypothetical protein